MPIRAAMDKLTHREVDVPTDLLAGLLMEQLDAVQAQTGFFSAKLSLWKL